jgi:hypothetical protein
LKVLKGKGIGLRHVGRLNVLKVRRFRARNGKLKKGYADCAGGGELRGGSDLFGRLGRRAELW